MLSITTRQIQYFLTDKVQDHLLKGSISIILVLFEQKCSTHSADWRNPRDKAFAEIAFDMVLLGVAHTSVCENLHCEQSYRQEWIKHDTYGSLTRRESGLRG